MAQGYFITGTDTGIGKTRSSVALMQYFKRQGKQVLGMKPVASGCEQTAAGLRNADAVLLQAHCSQPLAYEEVNPYAFSLAVSPHLAAEHANVKISLAKIIHAYEQLAVLADCVIVEGVGGWLVPLNNEACVADLAVALRLPVIVVVGIRLGCINQAKLTFSAIHAAGVDCIGWIASCVEHTMRMQAENIATISQCTALPLLGVLAYSESLDINALNKIRL